MRKTLDWAYHWTHDKSLICADLVERRGALTICLKTKDDPYFLEKWIQHHAQIVGLRNLVIFDNMSTDEAVWSIYEKFRRDLLVVQFNEYYDQVHNVRVFRELYETLKHSTAFFAFLDTDEFLVLVENDGFRANASIVDFLQSRGDVNWFPATWLNNAFRSESLFKCGPGMSVLIGGLKGGKPVVRAKAVAEGFINHNVQFYPTIVPTKTHTNLFALHLRNLSPEQRIAILTSRLRARSRLHRNDPVKYFMSEGDDLKTILAKETDHLPPAIKEELADLRGLVAAQENEDPAVDRLEAGHVHFGSDGRLEYFSEAEKDLLRSFVANADDMIQNALQPAPGH